jgi:hypothetical protein
MARSAAQNAVSVISAVASGVRQKRHKRQKPPFGRFSRFCRTFTTLEARCPDYVPVERWKQAVEDGRRFLAKWGDQAEVLGWTSAELFGLHNPPEKPHPTYCRLSRYDCTGLYWLLDGREVVMLTADTATIRNPYTSNMSVYLKPNKPALGPLGDSLDDLSTDSRGRRYGSTLAVSDVASCSTGADR